ncbi:MAG: flavodoxin domain-containing protein [Anaerolineae bacterium]|jgi:menaquinone-dependent protoporphyrinogen oxidase
MDRRVLVAYASKHGATAEIAKRIGEVLRKAGLSADVLPAERATNLVPYGAIILGSAIYIGRWRREATNFLETNEQALAKRKVWLFSSGPTGEGDPVELVDGRKIPEAVQPAVNRIQPQDVAIFHGVLDPNELNFVERWMVKRADQPTGDFRNWDDITAWATAIAEVLQE